MKNNYSSYEKNKVLKITLITITTAILAVGAFLGGGYVRKAHWESELRKNYSYAFIGENKEVEYGTEIRIVDLKKELLDVDLSLENIKISINGEDQTSDKIYKFLKINDNKIKCTLSDVIDGEQIIVAKTYIYKVIDTVKPVIEGISDKEINQGDEIDLKAGIIAKDPIDGDLEINTEGDFNKDVPGEYTITVKAKDKNNNESTGTFKVVVKQKETSPEEQKQEEKKTEEKKQEEKKQEQSKPADQGNSGASGSGSSGSSGNQGSSSSSSSSSGSGLSSGSGSSSSSGSGSSSGSSAPSTPSTPSKPSTPADTFNYKTLSSNATNTFNLVNAKRVDAGVNALTWDSGLAKVAEARAMDLSKTGTFSHTTPNLGTPAQTMQKYGISYTSLAENLAGNSSDSAAVTAWMNSPGHNKNMLNGKYKKTGIGVVTSPKYGKIYCQLFTN